MTSMIPLLLAIASDPLVHVEGRTTCPSAEQVGAQFPSWLRTHPDGQEPHVLMIEGDGSGNHLTLICGGVVTSETLESGAPCTDLAQRVAAKVAVWELTRCSHESAMAGQRPWTLEWGAGVRAGLALGTSVGFAPGALVEIVLRNAQWRLGPRLFLTGSWNDTALAEGGVYWSRPAVGLGLIHSWVGSLTFDVHEEVLGGILIAQGHDTSADARARGGFELGLGAGLRVGSSGRSLRVWVDVAGVFWPRRNEFGLGDSPVVRQDVPDGELTLSLGVTFPTAL